MHGRLTGQPGSLDKRVHARTELTNRDTNSLVVGLRGIDHVSLTDEPDERFADGQLTIDLDRLKKLLNGLPDCKVLAR